MPIVYGTAGNPGRVTGPARIISSEEDFSKILPGDVVLLPQSTAAIMRVISRIAAVVTDHGGITSHAATLSREHNIPCIVGTQKATALFKDGDRVEVDADAGTIKSL